MKKRIAVVLLCAALLLAGGLLLKGTEDGQTLPSFYWRGYNDRFSVSLLTPLDFNYVQVQCYENGLVNASQLDGGMNLEGKWKLKENMLTIRLENGEVITGILEGDIIQLDYAGGILLESYERLNEKYGFE